MSLALPFTQFGSLNRTLTTLVKNYNDTADSDRVQQIYYLQKINELLNRMSMDHNLLSWSLSSEPDGWEAQLARFNIHPDASFVLKGVQFAQAVANETMHDSTPITVEHVAAQADEDNYQFMQKRDEILTRESPFAEKRDDYVSLSQQLANAAKNCNWLKELVKNQTAFLEIITYKINSMKAREPNKEHKVASYVTTAFQNQVNNHNYRCKIDGKVFIIRVEDRTELGLEQKLHSYPVSRYFIEDYAVFRLGFKTKDGAYEYRPVVFSQCATQGNLAEMAKKLRHKKSRDISSQIGFYFPKLVDFCRQLINTHTYHPDIKLSNFLVHGNRIVLADRKTFINKEKPRADEIRSSPLFATDEYISCINDQGDGFNNLASSTYINMPQFMAYQLGMALKEFLILTQQDELSDEFRDHDVPAAAYFASPNKSITNLSLLVQELTRANPEHRMTLAQFQGLLPLRNRPTNDFYAHVELIFPAKNLGLEQLVRELHQLIDGSFDNNELLAQANPLFKQIDEQQTSEHRLTRLANILANKCFTQCSGDYLQALHNRITSSTDLIDLNNKEFHQHFPLLEFVTPALMTTALGLEQTQELAAYIAAQDASLFPRRDLIEELIASKLDGLAFIEQANQIFTELLTKDSIPPNLHTPMRELVGACLARSPYFRDLSARIENQLLAQDWQAASWFRRAIHWLSFGFFRVARVSQVSDKNFELNVSKDELSPFMLQLKLINDHAIATDLEPRKHYNLLAFTDALMLNTAEPSNAEPSNIVLANPSDDEEEDEEYSSSSVVIRKSPKTRPPLSSETMVVAAQNTKEELSSSIVIRPQAAPVPAALPGNNVDAKQVPRRAVARRLSRFDTFNTTLFKGDDRLNRSSGLIVREKYPTLTLKAATIPSPNALDPSSSLELQCDINDAQSHQVVGHPSP